MIFLVFCKKSKREIVYIKNGCIFAATIGNENN